MFKKLNIVLIVLLVSVVVPLPQLFAADRVYTATPTFTLGSSSGAPEEPYAFDDVSYANVGTTTRTVITTLTDRRKIEFFWKGEGEIWVGPGTTTVAVSSGILLSSDTFPMTTERYPLTFFFDKNVPISIIASTPASYTYIQYGYKNRQ